MSFWAVLANLLISFMLVLFQGILLINWRNKTDWCNCLTNPGAAAYSKSIMISRIFGDWNRWVLLVSEIMLMFTNITKPRFSCRCPNIPVLPSLESPMVKTVAIRFREQWQLKIADATFSRATWKQSKCKDTICCDYISFSVKAWFALVRRMTFAGNSSFLCKLCR